LNFLFCTTPHGPPESTGYDHGVVALAEGLEALNAAGARHRWSGTVPYWHRQSGPTPWLIPQDGAVHWGNADVVVVSYLLWGDNLAHPKELERLGQGVKLVFLDAMDGWRTFFLRPELRRFDVVLRTHLSRRYPRPANVKPWAFGLSNRIIEAVHPLPWSERTSEFLFNFRVGHPLRDWARRTVAVALARRFATNAESDAPPRSGAVAYEAWAQTGRRHYASYFDRLSRTAVGATYGGYFGPGLGLSLNSPLLRALYKVVQMTKIPTRTLLQFDSWRLWETFAAGALVIHLDLERYGAQLPEMPVNRVHYWAISPDTVDRDVADLLAAPDETLGAIADAGRRWALEHYSPEDQARRLLSYLAPQE